MLKHSAIMWAVMTMTFTGFSLVSANEKYDFTLQGDGTFNKPHGGQAIQVVVIHAPTRTVVARKSGTVSRVDNPAFSLTFPALVLPMELYEFRIWIDSNFGGGTSGKCDWKPVDHQWLYFGGTKDKKPSNLKLTHLPADMIDVCQSFTGL